MKWEREDRERAVAKTLKEGSLAKAKAIAEPREVEVQPVTRTYFVEVAGA